MAEYPPLDPALEFPGDEEKELEEKLKKLAKECEDLASLPDTESNKQKIAELKKRIQGLSNLLRFINS